MKIARRIILWTGITGVLPLPALSNIGYLPIDPEYILYAIASFLAGIACALVTRIRYVGFVLLLLLTILFITLYFGGLLQQSYWLLAVSIIFMLGLSILAFLRFEKALLLTGVVAFSQIIGAVILTPSYITYLKESPVTRSDRPSIVHILLDEHAGMAAIPPDAVSPQEVQEFIDAYVRRGFIVFTRAYTADKYTQESLNRLMNAHLPHWKKFIHVNRNVNFEITNAGIFDFIGENRAVDITHLEYVNMGQAFDSNPAIARIMGYNENIAHDALAAFPLPLRDRITVANDSMFTWFRAGVKSPLIVWFASRTYRGQTFSAKADIERRTHPLVARLIFHQLIERLSCCGERGTYYFAHLLYPHFPYILNKQCEVLPTSSWQDNIPRGKTGLRKLAARRKLYGLHFGQASCAAQDVFKLVEAVEKRKELSDAVIFVHSDHGSRIAILDRNGVPWYSKWAFDRDFRGSFIAIKIPGMEGRIINTPVRLDNLYSNLLSNDFQKLDLEKLRYYLDSPYYYK